MSRPLTLRNAIENFDSYQVDDFDLGQSGIKNGAPMWHGSPKADTALGFERASADRSGGCAYHRRRFQGSMLCGRRTR